MESILSYYTSHWNPSFSGDVNLLSRKISLASDVVSNSVNKLDILNVPYYLIDNVKKAVCAQADSFGVSLAPPSSASSPSSSPSSETSSSPLNETSSSPLNETSPSSSSSFENESSVENESSAESESTSENESSSETSSETPASQSFSSAYENSDISYRLGNFSFSLKAPSQSSSGGKDTDGAQVSEALYYGENLTLCSAAKSYLASTGLLRSSAVVA
jgi:hypothetical protein